MQLFYGNGGEGGIRTHGTVTRTLVFKTSALNHSATSPLRLLLAQECRAGKGVHVCTQRYPHQACANPAFGNN